MAEEGWAGEPPGSSGASSLTPTSINTTAFTLTGGQMGACDTSGGAFAVTLPAATVGLSGGIVNVAISGNNAVTATPSGTDQFLPVGSANPAALPGESLTFTCYRAGYWSLI